MAAYAALFCALSVHKFRHYLFTDFDLAIFAHAVDQSLRGSLYESIGAMPWLGGHVAPVLFLLAPLYAVFRHPLTLLFVQSAALALGAWPVYRLARRELDIASVAVGCAALYLLQPALAYTNLFEFHPEVLAVPALLFAFEALRRDRLGPMSLWTALALLTREDVALVVLAMGLLAASVPGPRRWTLALTLAGLAGVSLLLSFGVVMPVFGSGQTDYARMYARWGNSMGGVLGGVARDPLRALAELFATPGDPGDTRLKLLYHFHLLLPFGFLPLASPATLAVALPVLLEHFLSSRPSQHSIVFHYTALVVPFVSAAAVMGLANLVRLSQGRGRARGRSALAPALLALALTGAVASQVFCGPFSPAVKLQGIGMPEPLQPDDYDRTLEPFRDRMMGRVPRRGDVVAGFEFLPRFTDRSGLHALHHFLGGHYTFSTRAYHVPGGVTAVIADLGDGSLFSHVNAGTSGRWRELLQGNGLEPVEAADDLVLFVPAPREPLELWALADPPLPRPKPVIYDGQVGYVGGEQGESVVPAGGVLPLRTYWRRVAPVDRFFLTEIVVVDTTGQAVLQLWRYLGYTLHPVAEWPAGANARESYRLVIPPGLTPGRYAVSLRLWGRGATQAVCEADDPAVRAGEGWLTTARFRVIAPPAERGLR